MNTQKADFEAINWAWSIIRDRGDPEPTEAYWDGLLKAVSEKRHEGELYDELGQAILRAMEKRLC